MIAPAACADADAATVLAQVWHRERIPGASSIGQKTGKDMRRLRLLVPVAVAVFSRGGKAQTCVGGINLQSAPEQIGAGLSIGNDTKHLSSDVTLGSPNGGFASVGVGYAVVDGSNQFDDDPAGITLSGRVGYSATLGSNGRTEVCPIAGATWLDLSVDYLGAVVALQQTTFQVGGSVGYVLLSTGDVHIIPFVGLSLARVDVRLDVGVRSFNRGADTYTPGTLGLGISRSQFAIVGAAVIPFGLKGADPSFRIGLRYGVGRG